MISWNAARRIAVTLAERTERAAGDTPAEGRGFDYPGAVRDSLEPLAEFTGIELPEEAGRRLRVADRSEWIDFNIEGFGRLIEPLAQKAAAGTNGVTWAFGAATLSAQIGLLLGFLSSRVLGQYDTGPVPLDGNAAGNHRGPGEVFFLDGNIVSAAGRIGVSVDGLRLWIVLHEMTHALQFEGYPWLRGHLGTMLEELVTPLAERLGAREAVRRLVESARGGDSVQKLLLNRPQREAFDRMQATMSVIEGYSDYVMHHVGRSIVPGYDHLSRRMAESRMHRSPLETLVFRISGLDAKLEQYRLGEEFAGAVVSRQGMRGLNRVWDSPENLPSLEEVRDPGLWMSRMDRGR